MSSKETVLIFAIIFILLYCSSAQGNCYFCKGDCHDSITESCKTNLEVNRCYAMRMKTDNGTAKFKGCLTDGWDCSKLLSIVWNLQEPKRVEYLCSLCEGNNCNTDHIFNSSSKLSTSILTLIVAVLIKVFL